MLIRWSLQKGFIVLPRSSNPARIAANAAVFDFELDAGQIARLNAFDEGLTTGWHPARPCDFAVTHPDVLSAAPEERSAAAR